MHGTKNIKFLHLSSFQTAGLLENNIKNVFYVKTKKNILTGSINMCISNFTTVELMVT
jgi:hypothetical protein